MEKTETTFNKGDKVRLVTSSGTVYDNLIVFSRRTMKASGKVYYSVGTLGRAGFSHVTADMLETVPVPDQMKQATRPNYTPLYENGKRKEIQGMAASSISRNFYSVSQCDRCHAKVAWAKSKAGKWYVCETAEYTTPEAMNHRFRAVPYKFHECQTHLDRAARTVFDWCNNEACSDTISTPNEMGYCDACLAEITS